LTLLQLFDDPDTVRIKSSVAKPNEFFMAAGFYCSS